MADDFKTFDKSPIVTFSRLNKWSFGLREIILLVITALLVILVCIFAGLFGTAKSELTASKASPSAIVANEFCTTPGCLKTAARSVEFLNRSVDPCEDFFQFACGNYKTVRPVAPNQGSRQVMDDIHNRNEDRLLEIIEKPISRMHDFAAERKLKEFFQSCNDMYLRERSVGKPLVKAISSHLGGWWLGDGPQSTWDMNDAIKKVQTEFWTDALYQPRVQVDWYNQEHRIIELAPAGTGKWMYWSWYTLPAYEKYRTDYKKFIRRVGKLLVRDHLAMNGTTSWNTTKTDMDVEVFVNDTYTMEYNIAQIASNSRYRGDPYEDINKVTLGDLNTETGNVIDWVGQLSYLFNTAGVTTSTKVVILRREYFQNMTSMIASLPDADRKRMLYNYLVWRVAEHYVQELSWEYIHSNREIYVDTRGRTNFMGIYKYCFSSSEYYMGDALSSLYVVDFFSEDNKKTVHDITDNLKKALQSQLDKTPWMDDVTKKYAKEKLDNTNFKMGYPDWMANQGFIDQIYNGLTVNVSDYFGNLMSFNNFRKAQWNEDLMSIGDGREEWQYKTYDTNIGIYWYWNEIAAPAGVLQSPIYDKDQPHYSTFGSLATILGRYLHHVVDEWGKWYDKSGEYMGSDSWWTNKSITAYAPVRKCVHDIYNNASKTYLYPDGTRKPLKVNAAYYTPIAIAWTNGIRMGQIAYKDWLNSKGMVEKMLPGLGMTNEQMFFLSHAQTFCYDRDNQASLNYALMGQVEEDIRVNMAMGQLKEFSDAFGCKAGSKLNHPKKCDYY